MGQGVQAKWQQRQTMVFVALELLMRQKLEVRMNVFAILHFHSYIKLVKKSKTCCFGSGDIRHRFLISLLSCMQ